NGIVHRLNPSLFRIGYATLMKGLKERLKEFKPDIIHSHNLHPHLFQAVSWKFDLGYKLVAQLHYPEVTGIDHFSAKLSYPLSMKYLIMQQGKIDAFIVHTCAEERWLIDKGVDAQKVFKVNYPCVPSKLLRHDSNSVYKLEFTAKHTLLYIGRVTWRKGIHMLLQALPDVVNGVKDIAVIIAGTRDEKYYKMLLKLVDELSLNDYVIFKQALSERDKYEYMSSCTLFVSPSIKDIHPITLVEAQALGKPVISTTVGAIPEIVKNEETGLLVEPENPKQLAKAIKRLVLRENERRIIGAKARQWVKENFLLEATVNRLETIYSYCLD
ncbi:MAG: glycosyltransferase family 4 protein, partial [Nitrososphaerales archaeon]